MNRWLLLGLLAAGLLANVAQAQMLQGIVGDSNEGTNGGGAPPTHPTVAQKIDVFYGGSGNCTAGCTLTFPGATVAGQAILVFWKDWLNTTTTVPTVKVGAGSTCSGGGLRDSNNFHDGKPYVFAALCENTPGGDTTVTVTGGTSSALLYIAAMALTGVPTSGVADSGVSNGTHFTTSPTCAVTTLASTTGTNDSLFLSAVSSDAFSSISSGWTDVDGTFYADNVWSQLDVALGSYSATTTYSASASNTACVIVAIKPGP